MIFIYLFIYYLGSFAFAFLVPALHQVPNFFSDDALGLFGVEREEVESRHHVEHGLGFRRVRLGAVVDFDVEVVPLHRVEAPSEYQTTVSIIFI